MERASPPNPGCREIGRHQAFTTAILLAEVEEVLSREKFLKRLALAGVSVRELILGYAALAQIVDPADIPSVIIADPDDDAVLACAVAAKAQIIISGDRHLLELSTYRKIEILTAVEFLDQLSASMGKTQD